MPPTDRFVITFAAEPPQAELPEGAWAKQLAEQFLAACADIDSDGEEIGEPGEIRWYPDRTYAGRTYVPAVARTKLGYELFGYVSFEESDEGPDAIEARADFTGDTAQTNPDWQLDLNEMLIGHWRGEDAQVAEMRLVWGTPMVSGGTLVTAELANHAVDQCELDERRFTLIAADNYRGDYLEVKLWDKVGEQLAAESLYDDADDADDPEPADAADPRPGEADPTDTPS